MIAGLPPYLTWTVLIILGLNVWLVVVTVVKYVIEEHERKSFDRWVESQLSEDEDAES